MEDPASDISSTRGLILHSAYALFKDQGYHGTSMRQIAERAEIALGGIYNHFESKEEIFSTVLIDFHPAHEVIPTVLQAAGENLETFARHAAKTIMSKLRDLPDFLNLLFIEFVEFRSKHIPQLYTTIFPRGLEIAQNFAMDQQGLRDIPMDVILRAFLGLMFSLILWQTLVGEGSEEIGSEGEVDQVVEIFLNGIREGS